MPEGGYAHFLLKNSVLNEKMPRLSLLLFGLLVSAVYLPAQLSLQRIVDDWSNSDYLKHASAGISIVDANTGESVAEWESQRSLIPASNLKLVTTASALAILGPDYRFTTTLAYDGFIDGQGVLQGNIFIIGDGDPCLGSPDMAGVTSLPDFLDRMRAAIQQAGIRQVAGRVIGDDRIYSSLASGTHWQWLDLGNYYGCGAFGLNLHDNLYYLRFDQQTQLGTTPPVAKVEPAIPGLQFHNEVTSAGRGSGDNAYIYGSPYSYQRFLRGTIPVGSGYFTIKGAIPDPALFAAQQLTNSLDAIGILCMRPPASARHLQQVPEPGTVIYRHDSPSLAEIVRETNMESVNLYAEVLLRAIGLQQQGEGSASAGLEAIETYWGTKGIDFRGAQLYDGSGLSPRNALPARLFTDLMVAIQADSRVREAFMASLPLAGRSGSLRNYFKGTPAENNLCAKSGYIERVRAYTGYASTQSGRLLAFSMMINNYQGGAGQARRKLFELMEALCN